MLSSRKTRWLAQLVERLAVEREVGSIPGAGPVFRVLTEQLRIESTPFALQKALPLRSLDDQLKWRPRIQKKLLKLRPKINTRELKQRRFWTTHVSRKWTFCTAWFWTNSWANGF